MKAAKPKNGNGGLAEEYSAESRRDEDEDEDEINGDTVYELYSPLHYLQQLMKVFLRCLCFIFPSRNHDQDQNEEEEHSDWTWRSSGPWRRPTRPPISTGEGGQVN
ncbi:uncharacterized protein LOC116201102 isoform X1 [Punica granatum]|uniref:Uncharacterized protein LOC116201102 isoform X1 n=1 Tax=Punica granatum TaxID=22663 RepID=A0A218VZ83_PUNGR|nr:uncharacterized protein LOC116201102 isoform X1 [Punica granatum]OWM65603.1 hypothetical protein CDL15_Pgr017100 [Punica granatum]